MASIKFSHGFIFLDGKIADGQTGFRVLRVAISNSIKKWFNSSNQITLEHVKHKKSLYWYHGIIIPDKVYFSVFKIFVVSLPEQTQVTR